jgi:hypothetical protein
MMVFGTDRFWACVRDGVNTCSSLSSTNNMHDDDGDDDEGTWERESEGGWCVGRVVGVAVAVNEPHPGIESVPGRLDASMTARRTEEADNGAHESLSR